MAASILLTAFLISTARSLIVCPFLSLRSQGIVASFEFDCSRSVLRGGNLSLIDVEERSALLRNPADSQLIDLDGSTFACLHDVLRNLASGIDGKLDANLCFRGEYVADLSGLVCSLTNDCNISIGNALLQPVDQVADFAIDRFDCLHIVTGNLASDDIDVDAGKLGSLVELIDHAMGLDDGVLQLPSLCFGAEKTEGRCRANAADDARCFRLCLLGTFELIRIRDCASGFPLADVTTVFEIDTVVLDVATAACLQRDKQTRA